MKKWLSVLLVLLLLCSLCGVTAMAEDAEELPGVFAMVKMVSDEDGDMTDQLKALVALGMAPTLTIEEDGSAELDLFGETETIKFDFDAGTVDVGNDVVVPYTWEDEVLSFGGDGILFAFSKNASADVEKGVGPYELVSFGGEDEETLNEQLAVLKAMSMLPTLTIKEDDSAVMSLMGEEVPMSFDFDSMTVTSRGTRRPSNSAMSTARSPSATATTS